MMETATVCVCGPPSKPAERRAETSSLKIHRDPATASAPRSRRGTPVIRDAGRPDLLRGSGCVTGNGPDARRASREIVTVEGTAAIARRFAIDSVRWTRTAAGSSRLTQKESYSPTARTDRLAEDRGA